MDLKKMLLAGILSAGVSASAGEIEDLRAELAKTKARIAELEAQVQSNGAVADCEKDAFTRALEDGTLKVKMGTYFRKYQKVAGDDGSDDGWGSGYIDMNYVSKQYDNLQFGIGFLGHERIYERNEKGANEETYFGRYNTRAVLDDLWIKANFTDKSYIKAGRQKLGDIFGQLPALGAKIVIEDIENLKFVAGLFTEQVGPDYGASKMHGFDDVDGGNSKYGKAVYFANLTAKLGPAKITPFYYVQKYNTSVGGLTVNLKQKMNEDLTLSGNITGMQLRDLSNNSERDNTTEVYAADVKVDMGAFSIMVGGTQTMDDPDYKDNTLGYRKAFYYDKLVDKNVDNDHALTNDTRSVYVWLGAKPTDKLSLKFGWSQIVHDTASGTDDSMNMFCGRVKYNFTKNFALEARNTYYDWHNADNDIWDGADDMVKSELHATYSFQLGRK